MEQKQKIINLWKAVIIRAIKDLYDKDIHKRDEAKYFLFNNSKHLTLVCDLANIDKDKILKLKYIYDKFKIPQALIDYIYGGEYNTRLKVIK